MRRFGFALLLVCATAPGVLAQDTAETRLKRLESLVESQRWELDQLRKIADDNQFWLRLSDVAEIDKVILTGTPDPKGVGRYGIEDSRHPIRIYCYTFIPKTLDRSKKHPAIMLIHGGVHGDFGTYHVHLVRETLGKGYVVVAPEYRGSTGYGRGMYELIDYGGLENDGGVDCRNWGGGAGGWTHSATRADWRTTMSSPAATGRWSRCRFSIQNGSASWGGATAA